MTPRYRKINNQLECSATSNNSSYSSRQGYSGPFRATYLWNNIIHALQTQVEVRRRRLHLRTYNDCFTGSDAVDVVLSHLMQNIYFSSNDISRLKGVRLCQAFMDHRVFEPVGTRLFGKEKEVVFEDSNNSLYRFLDNDTTICSLKNGNDFETPSREDGSGEKKSPRCEQGTTISNPLALESSDERIEKLLETINLPPSLPSNIEVNGRANVLSKKVVEEVWKQQTLLQLLQLIDLPILDSILESPVKAEQRKNNHFNRKDDIVISNTFLDREVLLCLNLPQLDTWLSVAVECLEYFPDQLIVGINEQFSQLGKEGGVDAYKRLLFDTVAKYYSQDKDPLLSSRYFDIHSGICHLLESGKTSQALEAAQLCVRLLQPNQREELRRLLSFMEVVAQPEGYRLQKQSDNRSVVCRAFLKAVVQNKSLSKPQTECLVMFLMDQHTELFKTPSSLLEQVRRKLCSLQEGKDPDANAGLTFCQMLPLKEYEKQKQETTAQQLQHLIACIDQNQSIPIKDKKKLLKEFQKHHPVLFLQQFTTDLF